MELDWNSTIPAIIGGFIGGRLIVIMAGVAIKYFERQIKEKENDPKQPDKEAVQQMRDTIYNLTVQLGAEMTVNKVLTAYIEKRSIKHLIEEEPHD